MDPFSTRPGAVLVDDVLQHLGSPLHEQRLLLRAEAIVPRADRVAVAVAGEDRLSWLDSLSSQALRTLAPGESTELLLLDPNGHVEHAAAVVDDGETTWLIADRARAGELVGWLTKMRFRLRVEVRDASADYAVVAGVPEMVAALTAAHPAAVPLVWRDPWPGVAEGGVGYAAVAPHPGLGRPWAEVIVTRDEYARLADDDEILVAGVLAAEALRIAAWRPTAGDLDERAIPHELDWMRTAVHLAKGCYRGQETVAKVHNLGHPPRRLVMLHLDGSDSVLPERGAALMREDTAVGVVTSAALHVEDGPIALALVKRSAPDGDGYTVHTPEAVIAAHAEGIVPADAGAAAAVPRLPRLARRAR